MVRQTREPRLRVDADGVRIHELPGVRVGVWSAVLALGLSAVALLLVARRGRAPESPEPVATRARAADASAPAPGAHATGQAAQQAGAAAVAPRRPAPSAPGAAPRVPPAPAAPDANAAVANGDAEEPPAHEDPVFGQAQSGEPSGIALFPPPGTKPIKRGLLVPDDFELPPGYVRHYQATDDGERVPAILMFHPDYHPVDEHGDPIALPADRIVPPEMAPPGMPIEMLELPAEQNTQ